VEERVEPEEQQPVPRHPQEPLFSLVAGEGDGLMLGLAAGDTAGGAWELGYSAITEQAVVIAYELIQNRRIEPDSLRAAIRELDGSQDEEPVYRAETRGFRAWLDRAAYGDPEPSDEPGIDGVSRAAVVGVAFRRDPDAVIRETINLSRVFDRDPATLAASLIAGAATAASCFGQYGRDLVAGVRQAVVPVLDQLGGSTTDASRLSRLGVELDALLSRVGVADGAEALEMVGGDIDDPLQAVQVGLLLAAPMNDRLHVPVEQAARIGGSPLAAFVGALIGARVGIRAWPWPFANDTWFAEIGRRLVRGPYDLEGLPIPYAVEQHLIFGLRPGFH
jgi:ADP-ribosylglycohydrolase